MSDNSRLMRPAMRPAMPLSFPTLSSPCNHLSEPLSLSLPKTQKSSEQKMHLQRLISEGPMEVRCIDKVSDMAIKRGRPVVWSAVFGDYNKALSKIMWADKMGFDVYSTINPVTLPVTNGDLKPFKQTTKDSDIERITTLFFDFDPVRKTGSAATDEQIDDALSQSHRLVDWLEDEHGFSFPTIGLSGNGAHVLYRTDMTTEQASCFIGLYAGLKKRFDTEAVSFDAVVRNPARIARLMGTVNKKSDSRSNCVYSDAVTPAKVITDLADKITPAKVKRTWVRPESEQKAGKFIKNWDIVAAFQRAGLYLKPTMDNEKHFVTCLWADQHGETGPTDTVIYEGEWAQYHCSHAHCSHKKIQDVLAHFGENA